MLEPSLILSEIVTVPTRRRLIHRVGPPTARAAIPTVVMLKKAFAVCKGAHDTGDDGAEYGVDVARLLACTEEGQDADGWEDSDVSDSEVVVECELGGLPPAASRQTSMSAGVALHSGRMLL